MLNDLSPLIQYAGRYLQSPQRWGVLPTMSFWCRPDVGRSARMMIPVWMVTANLAVSLAVRVAWWAVPLTMVGAAMTMLLMQGLLERYLRQQASRMTAEQRLQPMTTRAGERDDDGVTTPRRTLVLLFAMTAAAAGVLSWQVWRGDARLEAKAQARQELQEQLKTLQDELRSLQERSRAFGLQRP